MFFLYFFTIWSFIDVNHSTIPSQKHLRSISLWAFMASNRSRLGAKPV